MDCGQAARYDPCAMDDKEITLRTVLDHIRGMEERVMKKLEHVDFRLEQVESGQQRMERNLMRQIDAIDKRLDEIEIAKLPLRVTRIEEHLQLTPI
jgi:esterase/lipase